MAIKAIVFDFDGTLMDTESCEYDGFCMLYKEYGQQLALEVYAVCVGTQGAFDPYAHLEQLTGTPLNHEEARVRFKEIHSAKIAGVELLPGVIARLEEAKALGLQIALASSSSRAWIERHLEEQGIKHYFEVVCTKDDVERVKPDPALYRLAIEGLGVEANEAIAVEDSMHGLHAAKAAGLFALVVPNPMTAHMDFTPADFIGSTLEELTFTQLIAEIEERH